MLVASTKAARRTTLSRRKLPPVPSSGVDTLAIIPTAWGVCGILWNNREDEDCSSAFAKRPANPLLKRIITPGLSVSELRQFLTDASPGCLEVLRDRCGLYHPDLVPEWFAELLHSLQSYYSGDLRDGSQPQFLDRWTYWRSRLDWSVVTPFQRQVLEIVARIPCGLQLTYGQVAAKIGKPGASRAVGAALGANPWPVLVPCHRVVGRGGTMTGFSAPGGVGAKRRMLDLEKTPGKTPGQTPGLFDEPGTGG